MNRRLLLAVVVVAAAVAGLRAQEGEHPVVPLGPSDRHSQGWQEIFRLKGPPLPPKFPKVGQDVERDVLDNGMVVYLDEDHRLPLINAVTLVRTGTNYESPEDLGIAALAGSVLRSGGTKNFPPEKLDDRLDFIAANLSVSMRAEECDVNLDIPQKDADEGLRILADVLRNPIFDDSRLQLAKRQTIFSLRASNDTPGSIIRREFYRLLYTEKYPTGRTPTIERVQQISRDDLVRFHEKYFHPNEIILGLTGDFNKADMLAKVRQLFGDWPKEEVSLPAIPKVDATPRSGVYYVSKPVDQSSLWIGHWGINRDNPDRFAIDLMNEILGGSSFSSRLTQRVRNDEGLAYDVGSAFPVDRRDISFFVAIAETRTEATVQAINSIIDEVRKMRTTHVSQNEFNTAKEMFLYSYVFNFAEPSQSLASLMRLEYEKLPADYLEKEFAGYQAVTPADIDRVAAQYLQPDKLTVFIVGDYPKFASGLSALGKSQKIQPLEFGGEIASRPRK